MSQQFIPMPWEDRRQPWTGPEVRMAQRLKAGGLTDSQIADRLAELGYPARDDTDISGILRAKPQ